MERQTSRVTAEALSSVTSTFGKLEVSPTSSIEQNDEMKKETTSYLLEKYHLLAAKPGPGPWTDELRQLHDVLLKRPDIGDSPAELLKLSDYFGEPKNAGDDVGVLLIGKLEASVCGKADHVQDPSSSGDRIEVAEADASGNKSKEDQEGSTNQETAVSSRQAETETFESVGADVKIGTTETAAMKKSPGLSVNEDQSQEKVHPQFQNAIELLNDYRYDDGFRLLIETYRLQSQAHGHQDTLSIEILETICSWELCNEFVSHTALVEALEFLEKLLPSLRAALPADSISLQLVEWRYADLKYKCDSSKEEQVVNIAVKAFEKIFAAMTLAPYEGNNVSTISWEHAHLMQKITKLGSFRSMTQNLQSQAECGLSPRARMRYQELLGRSAISTGNLREGLKDLLKLYKIECKSLKLNDPLLLSLLEGIHFSYTYFPGGNDKHVGFFRKAYETFKTPLGTEHSSTIVVQVLLASAISSCPQAESKLIKEGEELAQDAITKAIKIFGQNHWNTVKAKKSLRGIAKKQAQRLERALDLMEATVQTQAVIFSLDHPFYLDACMEFCAMNIKFKRFDAARKYAQIAAKGRSKKYGRHSRQAAEAKNYLAITEQYT